MTKEKKFLDLGTELFEEMAECGMRRREWAMPNHFTITITDLKRSAREPKKAKNK